MLAPPPPVRVVAALAGLFPPAVGRAVSALGVGGAADGRAGPPTLDAQAASCEGRRLGLAFGVGRRHARA